MSDPMRTCPLCDGPPAGSAFPYAIEFDGRCFDYRRCGSCESVFVDPVPDAKTLARMYAKSDYHDCHYSENQSGHYDAAAGLLGQFAPAGSKVLDYGCGFGYFLKAIQPTGFQGVGVEFDQEAAQAAARNAGCEALSLERFNQQPVKPSFDVIHLGDVLEHLPVPAATLTQLLTHLKPGGLLFVEGPLEINPSPVYWASRLFGALKHRVRPGFIGQGKPTHLFRTGGRQQLAFFHRVDPTLEPLHWDIYETGWPYAEGGFIKRFISQSAMWVGGRQFSGMTFGNRFTGLFRYKGN